MKVLFCLILVNVPILVHSFENIIFNECAGAKGCFKHVNCEEKSLQICFFGATWKKVVKDSKDYVEFELIGVLPDSGGFLSLGFSEDSSFGNDGVVGCYHSPYNSATTFYAGYNKKDPKTGSVNNIFIDKSETGLLVSSGDNLGSSFDGTINQLQCRFRRLVTPSQDVDKLKDLNPELQYYLILTRGERLTNTGFGEHLPNGKIFADRAIPISSLTYGSMTGIPGEGTAIAKAHGCCMILAWVFCSSVGIILARYYKDVWPNSGLFRQRVWFQVHRILQLCCLGLTILGFILILAYLKGQWSKTTTWPHYLHPILGIIIIVLTILNPLLAVCLCSPADERRPYFNWTHFIIGTVAYILAVPTMMLGLRMPAAGIQLASLDYPNGILIFFALFQFACEIILEIHGCIYYKRNQNKRHEFDMAADQYFSAIRVQSGPFQKPEEPEPSGRMFKYFMIGLNATVNALIAVILIIIIAVH